MAPDLDALRDAECSNVTATLDGLDRAALDRAIDLLDAATRRLWVLPSTQTEGVAQRLIGLEAAWTRSGALRS